MWNSHMAAVGEAIHKGEYLDVAGVGWSAGKQDASEQEASKSTNYDGWSLDTQ